MQLEQYKVDDTLAEEGKVIPLGADSWIKIAKFGNKKFNAMFNRLTAPYGKRIARIEPEEQERIYLECVAECVVLDWGGIMDGKEEIVYSTENVKAILKKYPEFHNEILELSREYATFRAEDMAEDLGNLQTPSETNSD